MDSLLESVAKRLFLTTLSGLREGSLELICGGEIREFGVPGAAPRATLCVHRDRFFRRAVFGGDIGIGEACMDGDWSSPDPVAVIRLAVRNLDAFEQSHRWLGAAAGLLDRLRHRARQNSIAGSRRNIRAHYDLSNDFFRLFLDAGMMYSCAYYETPDDSLETAQSQKLDRICRKLDLQPCDRVLEIGTGWGAFAEHAVRHYGCHLTTTTISREQHDFAQRRFERLPGRVELLLEDYRHLPERLQPESFDKLVSIEMFEAVGLEFYDQFFGTCDRMLVPTGSMLIQTITMNERKFPAYQRRTDWIQKYIFPGAELASVTEVLRSLTRATSLGLYHLEDIGLHYVRTLRAWRERFHAAMDQVRALGFDERFCRMWDFYLVYCEGAFAERHVGDVQLVLSKARAAMPGIIGEAALSAAPGAAS